MEPPMFIHWQVDHEELSFALKKTTYYLVDQNGHPTTAVIATPHRNLRPTYQIAPWLQESIIYRLYQPSTELWTHDAHIISWFASFIQPYPPVHLHLGTIPI